MKPREENTPREENMPFDKGAAPTDAGTRLGGNNRHAAGTRPAGERRKGRLARAVAAGALSALLAASLAGCGMSSTAASDGSSDGSTATGETSSAVSADESGMDLGYTDRDLDPSWDASSATAITLDGSAASVTGEGATVDGSTVTITCEGTYVISGTLEDGQVIVAADDSAKVQIVLDGVDIANSSGPAILVQSGDKVFITLAEGSRNSVSDGATYADTSEDAPDGCIYSTSDLTLNGTGSLTVEANHADGIVSTDDLVITGGTYTITAADDAIRGKDCVKICDGTFDLIAAADGIKSTNDSDATRGFVSIDGGTFDVEAGDEGIQAVTYARIAGGTLSIDAADDAIHSDGDGLISGGSLAITAGDDAFHVEYALDVAGGETTVASCYEGLEGQEVSISGGTNDITATDDGINATEAEAESTDESSSENARATQGAPQTGMMEGGMESSVGDITVSGGYTVLDVGGDGLDAGGTISMSDGVLIVCGPVGDGNGSLDYGTSATITGGTFLALGSSGMAQAFDSNSTQAEAIFPLTGSAGDLVSVCDADGGVLVSATAREDYSVVIASTPQMQEGDDYTVYVGGSNASADANGFSEDGTASGATSAGTVSATVGASGTMGMGGLAGGGGMGGAPGGSAPADAAASGGGSGTATGTSGQPPTSPQGESRQSGA